MIRAHRRQLEAICRQRGYDLAAAMACVVSADGDIWTIDETHAAYPRRRIAYQAVSHAAAPTAGPGTELKKLLSAIGITASPNCSCTARARQMDAWGADECERRLDEIVGWLREEATKRGLPFIDVAGRVLVRRAIRNARKDAARAGRSPRHD